MFDTTGPADALPEEEPLALTVPDNIWAERLDKVLAGLLAQHSRSRLQGWIEDGFVHVNGRQAKIRQLVNGGDSLCVWPQVSPEEGAYTAQPVAFDVVQESPDWIVVNKPAGLVTHPGAGNWQGTLLNGLLYRFPELAHVARAGIVHRLDKDTSGLLVVARSETAQTHLVRQLQARTMGREYVALVHGRTLPSGKIDQPIGRDPKVPVRMSVDRPIAPKPAVTHYVCERAGDYAGHGIAQLACRLETGRTHQIRVHLASLGHPLLADTLYGGKLADQAQRQMLHARQLRFDDPGGGGEICAQAPLPEDMVAVIGATQWQP
ncbi:MAG: RluA family pseudouridine synthase [Burkholderiaceae bacterium]